MALRGCGRTRGQGLAIWPRLPKTACHLIPTIFKLSAGRCSFSQGWNGKRSGVVKKFLREQFNHYRNEQQVTSPELCLIRWIGLHQLRELDFMKRPIDSRNLWSFVISSHMVDLVRHLMENKGYRSMVAFGQAILLIMQRTTLQNAELS